MGWQNLLANADAEHIVLPWTRARGRSLRSMTRSWTFECDPPRECGWYSFKLKGRTVTGFEVAEPERDTLIGCVRGYLIGDRLAADDCRIDPDPMEIAKNTSRVYLLDEGLDRFARVLAGSVYKDGPLVFVSLDMPLGPEEAVLQAFLDRQTSVVEIKGVTPALDAAFRMECWQREQAERRRRELERLAREEQERLEREVRRRELVEKLGDGAGRRAMAAVDFEAAARAALVVGGAELLDVRRNVNRGEQIVRYRLDGRRFECVCDERTLRIVDAGICLTQESTRERGDDRFTLESLPSVVMEAERRGVLVVFRHV
jgi:hypothetical protein